MRVILTTLIIIILFSSTGSALKINSPPVETDSAVSIFYQNEVGRCDVMSFSFINNSFFQSDSSFVILNTGNTSITKIEIRCEEELASWSTIVEGNRSHCGCELVRNIEPNESVNFSLQLFLDNTFLKNRTSANLLFTFIIWNDNQLVKEYRYYVLDASSYVSCSNTYNDKHNNDDMIVSILLMISLIGVIYLVIKKKKFASWILKDE